MSVFRPYPPRYYHHVLCPRPHLAGDSLPVREVNAASAKLVQQMCKLPSLIGYCTVIEPRHVFGLQQQHHGQIEHETPDHVVPPRGVVVGVVSPPTQANGLHQDLQEVHQGDGHREPTRAVQHDSAGEPQVDEASMPASEPEQHESSRHDTATNVETEDGEDSDSTDESDTGLFMRMEAALRTANMAYIQANEEA